jgi:hypothetical protein
MLITMLHGYPDYVGRRLIFTFNVKGPKPYVNSGTFATSGDPVQANVLGFQTYIDSIFSAVSVSGTYIVRGVPTGVGARQAWNLHWYTESSGTEVTNGTDLSAESVQISGFGGRY